MRSHDRSPIATESEARALLPALEAIAAATIPLSRDAERHAMRLRFALARVADLRDRIATVGGVFESARLEVAQSILQTHYRRASSFAITVGAARAHATVSATRFASKQSAAAFAGEIEPVLAEKRAA